MVRGTTLLWAGGIWALLVGSLPAAETAWMNNYASAVARAEKLQRPLLVHFYGSTCPPCRTMEREVLHQPAIEQLLSEAVVGVMVNASNSQDYASLKVAERYGVYVLPTDVVIHPRTNKNYTRTDGSQQYDDYLRKLSIAIREHRKDLDIETAAAEKEKTQKYRRNEPDPEEVQLGGEGPLVGLQGYSPVSLVMKTEWVRGKPEFAWEFKGVVYHMATRLEYDSFRARPEDFAPKYLGCDPVVLSMTDKQVAGRIEYGAFYEGDLFLFTSAENRALFKELPLRYLRLQHVMNAGSIDRSTLIR